MSMCVRNIARKMIGKCWLPHQTHPSSLSLNPKVAGKAHTRPRRTETPLGRAPINQILQTEKLRLKEHKKFVQTYYKVSELASKPTPP